MRDVSKSGASGHGEEPMADPCVNARRTRRITARQSHLPKIRDDRKSVDCHEQIGLRYGSRSSTIGPASSRLKRKPASSRTARRQAADRVLMCTGFWRPPAKKVPVFAAENRELAPAVYLTKDANFGSRIAPDCAPIIGRRRETISGRRVAGPVDGNGQRAMSNTLKSGTKGLLVAVSVARPCSSTPKQR
jgi:hypothetical protein